MQLFPSLVLLSLTVITIQVMPLTNGANILVTVLIPKVSSHAKSMSAISGALTRRGHNVTILTSSAVGTKGFKRDTYNSALQYKFEHSPEFHAIEQMIQDLSFEKTQKSQLNKVIGLGKVFYLLRQACENLLQDSATLALLKESNFDILIGDAFDGCDAILSSYLGIHYIALTTSIRYPFFHEHLYGIPSPSSYVPLGIFPLSDRMTFLERVASFIEHNFVLSFSQWVHFGALENIKDKHGIAPGRSIPDLIGGAELWLCMTNFAFDFSHPIAPNWVAIGNIADIPAKPLNKDYEAFVEGSGEHGFIILALGNNYGELPKHIAEAFARVFSDLPQRVIWRHTGKRPRYLSNNTMLVDWMPQNDLLGHPKARLLIYHGGLTGIFEAIYHAVPMVVMPIFAEQDSNAVKVEAKGMGRILKKDPISYETVMEAVIDVLESPRYRENVRRSSRIYRDTQAHPDETVVYWVEHILKFGGSHLRSRALELSFTQLHSIDVLAFIIGIIVVIVFLLYTCSKRCLSCCSKNRKSKVE